MRVIFFGTSAFAVPSLTRIAASGHQLVMCVTQPDQPQGRGLRLEPSPVKRAAQALGVPIAQPQRLSAEPFAALDPEVGVLAAYGQLIRRDALDLPRHGILGVHPSLLPKYRGAAPVAWALLNGDTKTGVTIFRLNERLDTGQILLQEPADIEPREDAGALTDRMAQRGATMLLQALEQLASGAASFHEQDESQASYAPKLTKTQGTIDWRAPAEAIGRLIRATQPWPGASTTWQGEGLKLVRTGAMRADRQDSPISGTVVQVTPEAIWIATGSGTLEILEVQPAGRRRMSVKEFLAGHVVRAGERFGTGAMHA